MLRATALVAAILLVHCHWLELVLANDNGRAVAPPAGWRSWVRQAAPGLHSCLAVSHWQAAAVLPCIY